MADHVFAFPASPRASQEPFSAPRCARADARIACPLFDAFYMIFLMHAVVADMAFGAAGVLSEDAAERYGKGGSKGGKGGKGGGRK